MKSNRNSEALRGRFLGTNKKPLGVPATLEFDCDLATFRVCPTPGTNELVPFPFVEKARNANTAALKRLRHPKSRAAKIRCDIEIERCGEAPSQHKNWVYCSFAYSALASFRIGMSWSASFHVVKKF